MAYGRSSAIERFRSHAGSIFPDINATLFQKSKKRSQDPQICKLLGLSGDPHKDKTPPMLAPQLPLFSLRMKTPGQCQSYSAVQIFSRCVQFPLIVQKKKFIVVLFNILGFRLGA